MQTIVAQTNNVVESLKKILISVLQHNNFEIRNDLSAKDVDGWDSLTHMVIITEIEKEFNIRFKLKELNKVNNLGDLIELIRLKI